MGAWWVNHFERRCLNWMPFHLCRSQHEGLSHSRRSRICICWHYRQLPKLTQRQDHLDQKAVNVNDKENNCGQPFLGVKLPVLRAFRLVLPWLWISTDSKPWLMVDLRDLNNYIQSSKLRERTSFHNVKPVRSAAGLYAQALTLLHGCNHNVAIKARSRTKPPDARA